MVKIKRIGVLQAAKFAALAYLLVAAIFCIPMGLIMIVVGLTQGQEAAMGGVFGGIGLFFAPLLYAVGGFIGGAIAAAIYNFVAGLIGGIEVEFEQ